MFRSSRKDFRLKYYISSLVVPYSLLLLYLILTSLSGVGWNICIIKLELNERTVVGMLLIIILFVSFYSLWRVKKIIDGSNEVSNVMGTHNVEINEKYNQGFRDFIMSVLVPILSTFSIHDQPVSTLCGLITIQWLTYMFYVNSSDIFPNISLAIWGYSVFFGTEIKPDSGLKKMWYVFGQTEQIEELILTNRCVVALGDPSYKNNNIAVIIEEDNK